jgi:hypothetical protein
VDNKVAGWCYTAILLHSFRRMRLCERIQIVDLGDGPVLLWICSIEFLIFRSWYLFAVGALCARCVDC